MSTLDHSRVTLFHCLKIILNINDPVKISLVNRSGIVGQGSKKVILFCCLTLPDLHVFFNFTSVFNYCLFNIFLLLSYVKKLTHHFGEHTYTVYTSPQNNYNTWWLKQKCSCRSRRLLMHSYKPKHFWSTHQVCSIG